MSAIVFCNACFCIQQQTKRLHFITSCSHVFCESCLSNVQDFCRICNQKCRALPISKELPEHLKAFFKRDSIPTKIEESKKIYNFQENQVKLYNDHFDSVNQKYQQIKETVTKIHKYKADILEACKIENEIITKLRAAHKNNSLLSKQLLMMSSSGIMNSRKASSPVSSHSGNSSMVSVNSALYNYDQQRRPSAPERPVAASNSMMSLVSKSSRSSNSSHSRPFSTDHSPSVGRNSSSSSNLYNQFMAVGSGNRVDAQSPIQAVRSSSPLFGYRSDLSSDGLRKSVLQNVYMSKFLSPAPSPHQQNHNTRR